MLQELIVELRQRNLSLIFAIPDMKIMKLYIHWVKISNVHAKYDFIPFCGDLKLSFACWE